MEQPTPVLAYTAGLFDGEGSITIQKSTGKLSPRYSLAVTLANTYEPVVRWVADCNGGKVYKRKGVNSPLWAWSISAHGAYAFLTKHLYHLRVKREQAQVAIDFQEHMMDTGRPYIKVAQELLDRREEYRQKLLSLRGKGQHNTVTKIESFA